MEELEREQTTEQENAGWKAEIDRLKIMPAESVRIWRDEFRRLHVLVEGQEEHVDVKPAVVFPVSAAADFVSFLDSKDKEVLLLKDLGGLDRESQEVLSEELNRVYFVPKIVRIYDIEDAQGAARWDVKTDRGDRVFDVRDREDVRVVHKTRVLLQDADGNRFEIEDLTELDERSQRLLDTEI